MRGSGFATPEVQAPDLSATVVPALVARQAAEIPDAIALTGTCQVLTYGALEHRANGLANLLRLQGVRRNELVCICLPRSLDLVVAELAVLTAGGAYVPLDPGDPAERLNFMARDCEARICLTTAELAERIQLAANARVIALDRDAALLAGASDRAPESLPEDGDLAYVIYTSGSTGQPKGVEITHGSLINLVRWHQREFGVTASDRATQMASVGFDASVWEVWPYLTAGASIHLPAGAIHSDPPALRDWLVAQGITISFAPTALAERLIRLQWPAETRLRCLLTGADTLRSYPPASLPFVLVNNYGPTECTVVATSGQVPPAGDRSDAPAIGWPIANTEILILDERQRPVKDGETGEICIGGAGLARGYHNRAKLTAEKFIRHPLSNASDARLYRSGDRGRRLADGQIQILGRMDEQVKIRGYRVEVNEVATALAQCEHVADSAIAVHADAAGERQLVAYVAPAAGERVSATAVRKHLRALLPEYMVPAVYVELARLPRTLRGKLDRAALPAPESAPKLPEEPSEAAANPLESRVSQIVCQLLQVSSVGRHDNFFLLGGHSLLAAQLTLRLREAFGVDVALKDLFDGPTVADLSAQVQQLLAGPQNSK